MKNLLKIEDFEEIKSFKINEKTINNFFKNFLFLNEELFFDIYFNDEDIEKNRDLFQECIQYMKEEKDGCLDDLEINEDAYDDLNALKDSIAKRRNEYAVAKQRFASEKAALRAQKEHLDAINKMKKKEKKLANAINRVERLKNAKDPIAATRAEKALKAGKYAVLALAASGAVVLYRKWKKNKEDKQMKAFDVDVDKEFNSGDENNYHENFTPEQLQFIKNISELNIEN